MKSNPYEFSNVDDPQQNTDAACHACPEFFEVIRIQGNLSESQALRMAARCKAIPRRNPKTGKPTSTINGLLPVWGVCALLVYFTGSKLVNDIKTANFGFENLLFWLTTVVIPVFSIAVVFVTYRRIRFRIETADPPIWGDKNIELGEQFYSAERHSRDGKLCHTLFPWQATQVLASSEAWLLNLQMVNPILIPRSWLTTDQQAVFDRFLDGLNDWQVSQSKQHNLASLPDVFPPLPTDGIQFKVGTEQHADFERLSPQIYALFPKMHRHPFLLTKAWAWKCWGICICLCAVCWPCYVLFFVGKGTINLAFLLPCLLGWGFYQLGRSTAQNPVPGITGVITDSAVWLKTAFTQTRIPLRYYCQCILVDNVLLLSAENGITPLGVVRSSFATEADWQTARQLIDAAIGSRSGGDTKHDPT